MYLITNYNRAISIFYTRILRMLELVAIGIVLYGVALIMYVYFQDYIQLHSKKEGFANVPSDIFTAKVVPGDNEDVSRLSPGPAMNVSTEYLVASNKLPVMDQQQARNNWGAMTSESCYRSDKGEVLKKTRNYLQRTNNYSRSHPDSCSAPNHEFIGTFYTPFDGVGSVPEQGVQMTLAATCLR